MKQLHWSIFASLALMMLTSIACGFQLGPQPVPPDGSPTQAPVEPSAAPTLVAAPTEAASLPTLVTVDLSGPPMAVGSIYPYVDGSLLVAVPGGPFTMGHGGSDNPEHKVTLSDFWIYQAKVTNQQFALCVAAGKCKTPNNIDNVGYGDILHANDPVTGVNWEQANSYCTFVHGTLPSEAQWEKTARGPDGSLYPWGDHAPACDYLNYNNCVGRPTDVTKYQQGQSYYHALDMEGNAFEWVNDWYNALYYKSGPLTDPFGPDTGQQRSVRSTGYKSKDDQTPASTRFFSFPNDHRRDLGFRCVVLDPTFFAPLCQGIGTSDGGSSDCPKVGIGLTPVCQAGLVTVVFTDSNAHDPNATISGVGSCAPVAVSPGAFPQVYNCSSGTTAVVQSKCTFTASGPVKCAPHYTLDSGSGMCKWDGGKGIGTQCLPGYTFDPALQCCTAETGTVTYPICPTGQALAYVKPGNPVCVPDGQAQVQPYHSELVQVQDPSTCTGGGKPSACEAGTSVAAYCRQLNMKFNPVTCTCY